MFLEVQEDNPKKTKQHSYKKQNREQTQTALEDSGAVFFKSVFQN
jgi:hypothetical protein